MNTNRRLRGFSLVELMVALLIGSFLIIGAVTVYVQSRNTYAVNETVARLQENARYALSTLEPDIRLANYWGLTNDAQLIAGALGNTPLGPPLTADNCGAGFDIDLLQSIDGTNNSYNLGCPAGPAAGVPDPAFTRTPDTIVVRHAAEATTPAVGDALQIHSTLQRTGRLFNSATAPGAPADLLNTPPFGPRAEIHDLVVRAYYVSAASSQARLPSLRRKNLVRGNPLTVPPGPRFMEEEILPGVEDLQVQFGIDFGADNDGDGVIDDLDGNGRPDRYNGIASQYVNPGDPALATAQVVAVRLWLLVRAETAEVGYTNTTPYSYADVVNYTPNDGFRRLLVSRTIQIRNTVNLQS